MTRPFLRSSFFLLLLAGLGCGESHGDDVTDALDHGTRDLGTRDLGGATDLGVDCPNADAGPIGWCHGGPCCDDRVPPTLNADCEWGCGEGYAFDCTPDPAALCMTDRTACDFPSDCVVTANTCCGECGEPTLAGSTAVNQASLSDYRDLLCADNPVCPRCAVMPNPELVATCEANECRAVDIGMEAMTQCSSDAECVIRTTDCCECGGATDPGSLIAIRADAEGAYTSLICDPGFGCPECLPVYPDDAVATCNAGRCTVAWVGP